MSLFVGVFCLVVAMIGTLILIIWWLRRGHKSSDMNTSPRLDAPSTYNAVNLRVNDNSSQRTPLNFRTPYPPQSTEIGFTRMHDEIETNAPPYPLENTMPQARLERPPYPLMNPHPPSGGFSVEVINRTPRPSFGSRAPYPMENPHSSTGDFAPPPSYNEAMANNPDVTKSNFIKRQKSL